MVSWTRSCHGAMIVSKWPPWVRTNLTKLSCEKVSLLGELVEFSSEFSNCPIRRKYSPSFGATWSSLLALSLSLAYLSDIPVGSLQCLSYKDSLGFPSGFCAPSLNERRYDNGAESLRAPSSLKKVPQDRPDSGTCGDSVQRQLAQSRKT